MPSNSIVKENSFPTFPPGGARLASPGRCAAPAARRDRLRSFANGSCTLRRCMSQRNPGGCSAAGKETPLRSASPFIPFCRNRSGGSRAAAATARTPATDGRGRRLAGSGAGASPPDTISAEEEAAVRRRSPPPQRRRQPRGRAARAGGRNNLMEENRMKWLQINVTSYLLVCELTRGLATTVNSIDWLLLRTIKISVFVF
ncbi:uncharacterized protein LOC142421931 [Mycteria americana]|uniref:uncharacterized protein LOC142421931 n=1 Tax=Mycteria americana TaxID=33587 RepID=UPI003F5863E5